MVRRAQKRSNAIATDDSAAEQSESLETPLPSPRKHHKLRQQHTPTQHKQHQQQQAAQKEQKQPSMAPKATVDGGEVDIKVECEDPREEELLAKDPDPGEPEDKKPDLAELQLELEKLQRQQQQKYLMNTPAKRVFLFGSEAPLPTSAATTITLNNNTVITLKNPNLNGARVASVNAPHPVLSTAFPTILNAAVLQQQAAAFAGLPSCATGVAIGGPAPPLLAGKLTFDGFEKDEFDLQESDSDEEGYSDIDFDEEDELIEDDEETDAYDPTWSAHATEPRKVFRFDTLSAEVGLQGRPKSTFPIFYLDRLLGNREAFFAKLALGCNERMQLLLQMNNMGQTFLKLTDAEEMQIFIGLCLQMSSLRLSTLAEYWNENACYGFKGFGGKMSYSRFQMLMRALNFEKLRDPDVCPEDLPPRETALKDLGPLLEFFNRRMLQAYKCGSRMVISEPVVFWKGRMHWLKAMNEKFRCNALTLHFLSEQSGLLHKIVIDVAHPDTKEYVKNSRLLVAHHIEIVKDLLQERLGSGHTVFTSKHYGSYGLCYELLSHDTYCTGYLEKTRYGNCKQLILTPLEKNSFATKYANAIMMAKWRRSGKCVYFYSSDCIAIYAKETTINSQDPRPKLIKELEWQLKPPRNLRDQMLSYQLWLEDSQEVKWDNQVAIYVLNLLVFNAYLLYTMNAQIGRARLIEMYLRDSSKLKSYAEFRQDIIATLLGTRADGLLQGSSAQQKTTAAAAAASAANAASEAEKTLKDGAAEPNPPDMPGSVNAADRSKLLAVEHLPMIIPRRKGKVMKKKCRICRKGGLLTFTKLCCEVCPGMPGLCEAPCFKIFHDQLKNSLEAGKDIKMRTFGTSGEKTIYF